VQDKWVEWFALLEGLRTVEQIFRGLAGGAVLWHEIHVYAGKIHWLIGLQEMGWDSESSLAHLLQGMKLAGQNWIICYLTSSWCVISFIHLKRSCSPISATPGKYLFRQTQRESYHSLMVPKCFLYSLSYFYVVISSFVIRPIIHRNQCSWLILPSPSTVLLSLYLSEHVIIKRIPRLLLVLIFLDRLVG
jgi:hypothetical protein